ncbi:MAG: MBL fold metallo-hydrolase [Bacteroidales bacterium]|jgi:hydroxyacylglutathione hydrolase|nr:MBL fold metallo-hydrolase [Bacteroidales bacterium]
MKILRHKSGNANMYFVSQAVGWILVDAGRKSKRKQLIRFMMEHEINPCDIKFIFVTHVHYDHVGNLKWLQQWTKAKIIVHEDAVENLEMGWMDELKTGTLWAKLLLSMGKLFPKTKKFAAVKPDILIVYDTDLSEYGFDAKIMHTPGHTKGSMSLIVNSRYAFVGDLCFNLKISKYVIPPLYQDYQILYVSWEKLNESGVTEFYPGHGAQFSISQFLDSFAVLKRLSTKV